jgi:hypothetical protein
LPAYLEALGVMVKWGFGRLRMKLSEKEKYEITSWAFSYFMKSNLTISDAVVEAVKRVKPDKIDKNGELKVSRSDILELQLRVKNLL